MRGWYAKNRERLRAYKREKYALNREKLKAKQRAYYNPLTYKQYYELNKVRLLERKKRFKW
jgi:hypothetical protein